jgi:hypothetical protein
MRPSPADLATIAGIARRHHLTDIDRRCRTARQQAAEGLVTVAVLGRFKAGKTTLLNQLLGEDLLPVQAIPATAVITRLRFGPVLRVSVKAGTGAPFAIEPGEIGNWATETGNPSNCRDVDWVDVASPALAELAGLVLVDTPGTGSSWEHNTRASLDWLTNVGAAVIAVNATQPLAEDDLKLLELLQPHTADADRADQGRPAHRARPAGGPGARPDAARTTARPAARPAGVHGCAAPVAARAAAR